MLELKGKHNTAKVFTDVVDNASISQVIELLNQPYVAGSCIRMMPDMHAGAGCTIGTTMTIQDKICPNLVGVDIGCGMEVARIEEKEFDPQKLDNLIREAIPSGFDIRDIAHGYAECLDLSQLYCVSRVDLDRAYKSIGTLGGGNHFIEVDKDEDGNIYVVIHSGSRHLGVQVANHYQEEAFRRLTTVSKSEIQFVVENLKAQGRQSEISDVLKTLKEQYVAPPKALAYVEGELFQQYLYDMAIAQKFAELNRQAMMDIIITGMDFHVAERFTTMHNYIDMESCILRKGAVSAQAGEKLIIPMNMRDGSLICIGKGNEDWNFSAPHGAGRLMSRSAAKGSFSVGEYRKEMQGIFTTCVGYETLDECPMAYKPMESILANIGDTVDVVSIAKPVYNFKAGN